MTVLSVHNIFLSYEAIEISELKKRFKEPLAQNQSICQSEVISCVNSTDNISLILFFYHLSIPGTCGNVAVLTTIYHVVRSSRATLDNTLIYVIVLSCVDFGVCLSLPITVIDQVQ